jgi:hypothetical protein
MTITLYQHPDYIANKEDLTRYRDLYEGKRHRITLPAYLWPHALEMLPNDRNSSAMYVSRLQRTRYFNIPEVIVSIWTALFFSTPLQLDDPTIKELGPRLDDSDGLGNSFNSLVKDQILKNMLIYGRVWVAVDNYATPIATVGQQRALGIEPFFSVLDPLSVVDWAIEDKDPKRVGRLNFLRQVYIEMLPRTEASDQPKYQECSDVYLIRDGKYVLQKFVQPERVASNGIPDAATLTFGESGGWTLAYEVETQLDEIPISYYTGDSWIKDVCEETLRFFNLRSNRDNVLYYQGYQKLVVKGTNLNDPEQRKAVSEYTMLGVPTDGDVFAIEPADTGALDRAVTEAFDSAIKVGLNQLRVTPQDSRSTQSAEAVDKERENTRALLSSAISELETLVTQSLSHFMAFKGKQLEPEVTILGVSDAGNITSKLDLILAIKEDLRQLPGAKKEILKQLLSLIIVDPERFSEIEQEIDSITTPDQPRQSLRALLNGESEQARGRPGSAAIADNQ